MSGQLDILVVGAGPGGCAAGMTAARAGARVAVVDRARFPRPKTCGDAVSNSAARLIHELGAGALFDSAERAVVTGAAAVFPDGSRVERSYGSDPGYIVTRRVLDELLRRALEQSGALVEEGVQVRGLTSDGARITGAAGDHWSRRASVVIAADGPGSLAWQASGRQKPKGKALGYAITGYFEHVGSAVQPGYSEHYFDREVPSGYGWIFPAVAGVTNAGVYLRADRFHAQPHKLPVLMQHFMAREQRRFESAKRVGRLHSWPLPLASSELAPAMAGLLSCGDAARLVDPLTGEGIWHALYSGVLAGEAALDALAHGGMTRSRAREFQLRCAREVTWPTALRRGLQAGIDRVVRHRLYTRSWVKRTLAWGYGQGGLELSKSVE